MRKTWLKRISLTVTVAMAAGALAFSLARAPVADAESQAALGEEIFQDNCSGCHFTDKTQTKVGPGLKGLFAGGKLPASGRPVSEENVIDQMKTPYRNMPSFAAKLTDEQMAAVVAYLKAL